MNLLIPLGFCGNGLGQDSRTRFGLLSQNAIETFYSSSHGVALGISDLPAVCSTEPTYHLLFSSGKFAVNLEDEDFQKAVFDSIVSPLLEDLKDFEGEDQIH